MRGREGPKHRAAKAVVCKKLYQCLRCNKRSFYGNVSGLCHGLEWIEANKNREKEGMFRWKDKFMDGYHLQRVVDVRKGASPKIVHKVCCWWAFGKQASQALERRLLNLETQG